MRKNGCGTLKEPFALTCKSAHSIIRSLENSDAKASSNGYKADAFHVTLRTSEIKA